MRKVLITLLAVTFAAGLAVAQEKAATTKSKERQISGEILGIDEAKSTIMITHGNEKFVVTFNKSTKWTKPEGERVVSAKRSDFKQGERVICMVTADEKGHFVARRIDLRPPQ
jgi:Ni/Co efflux regulator RcnB